MGQINLKQRLMIITGLIFLALLVVGLLVVWPAMHKIYSLRQEINTIENDLEKRYQDTQKLKRTLRELEDIKMEMTKLNLASISKGDELQIITELENLANTHQIDQTINISLQKVPKEELKNWVFPEYYSISFLDNGSFPNLISYLHDIDTLPYYIIIKNIRFEKRPSPDKNNSPTTLTFSGIIYAKSDKKK